MSHVRGFDNPINIGSDRSESTINNNSNSARINAEIDKILNRNRDHIEINNLNTASNRHNMPTSNITKIENEKS